MRWMKKIILAMALLAAGCGAYAYATRPEPTLMEYRVTAQPGDTVWGICGRIATDRDNLSEVVWRAMKDSGIKKAADLQPGQMVIVRVLPVDG